MAEKSDPDILRLHEHEGTYHYIGTKFDEVRDLQCREDDIWACSFPRSGTTLTQQTVYLIQTLDFEKGSTIPLEDRFPMIELEIPNNDIIFRGPSYVVNKRKDEPRMIKSHLHYRFLPRELKQGKGKIIYIVRNPKASVPSAFRVLKYIKNSIANTMREFVERFLTDKNFYACPWGEHVREYWKHRNDENVLFLQYEHCIKDRVGTVRKIADFIGKDLTDEQVDEVVKHTSLQSMKANKSANFSYFEDAFNTDKSDGEFINTGEISGWRKDIPEDLVKPFDEMIERELGQTDITFPE